MLVNSEGGKWINDNNNTGKGKGKEKYGGVIRPVDGDGWSLSEYH